MSNSVIQSCLDISAAYSQCKKCYTAAVNVKSAALKFKIAEAHLISITLIEQFTRLNLLKHSCTGLVCLAKWCLPEDKRRIVEEK